MSEMESMRVVIHQQAGQIVNLIGQFRSMGEEIKKLRLIDSMIGLSATVTRKT